MIRTVAATLCVLFVVAFILIGAISSWHVPWTPWSHAMAVPWYGWLCLAGAIVSFGVGERDAALARQREDRE